MQGLHDVAAISQELAAHPGREWFDGSAGGDMAWRPMQGPQFSLVIDDAMPCEAIAPPPGGRAPRRQTLADFVGANAMVVTDGKGWRVDEGKPGAAPLAGGEVATQRDQRAWEECDTTSLAHEVGEVRAQMHRSILRVVMRAGPGVTPVQRDQKRQHVAQLQCRLTRAVTLAHVQQVAIRHGRKSLAAIVNSAAESQQLVQRGSQVRRGRCVAESAKPTGASCLFLGWPTELESRITGYQSRSFRYKKARSAGDDWPQDAR
jgi:hypothetical protein